MQFVYVKDLVSACVRAMDEPHAVGHAFNIANARPVTQTEVVEALAKACRKKPKFVRIPRERILRAGGHPMGPKLYFGVYFDMPPITQVITKAQRVLKFKPTDFVEGLKETFRWYTQAPREEHLELRFRRQAGRVGRHPPAQQQRPLAGL